MHAMYVITIGDAFSAVSSSEFLSLSSSWLSDGSLVGSLSDLSYSLFTNVCVGWPGSVHDARVFANSSLYKKASTGNVLTGDSIIVNGIEVSPFLVADFAYSLLTWLMKPFGESENLTQQKNTSTSDSPGRELL